MDDSAPVILSEADRWIISILQTTEGDVERSFAEYRFDNAAGAIYKFVWDEYCDWYLEMAKVQLADSSGSDAAERHRGTRRTLVRVLEAVLRLAHPITPFITEELWQKVAPLAAKSGPSIMIAPYPKTQVEKIDLPAEDHIARLKDVVLACRNLRGEMKVSPATRVPLFASGDREFLLKAFSYLRALARLSEATASEQLPDIDAPVAVAGGCRLMLRIEVDYRLEQERVSKEISRLEDEIRRANAKLDNKSFVEKAPAAVVELERQRIRTYADNLDKLRMQARKHKA